MSGAELALACVLSGIVATVGAVTGGNSLVTVPMLIFFGLDATTAVATNMVGVTALNAGAGAQFTRERHVGRYPTLPLIALAIPGSMLGAFVAIELPPKWLEAIIATAMIGLAAFILLKPTWGAPAEVGRRRKLAGYAISAVWAVYGGLFSGGYATILTALVVTCFGTTLIAAVAATKWVNFVSSLAAVAVFAGSGVIDWMVAGPLAASMLLGGVAGARWASRTHAAQLKRLLAAAVVVMGALLVWRVVQRL